MPTRGKIALAALLLAAAALPPAARAQIAAPRLVDEAEEAPPAEEAPAPARPPGRGAPEPDLGPPRPAKPAPAAPAAPGPGPAAPPTSPDATTAPAAGAQTSPARPATPAAQPPRSPAADLSRRMLPVQATYPKLMAIWAERRTALREADAIKAEGAEKALLAVRNELGMANVVPLAAVEIRDSRRALQSNLFGEAIAHARSAVALAPDLPDAHLALARAAFADAPSRPGPALAALRDAVVAIVREPHTLRSFYGDLASAALAAALVASLATLLLLVARRLRLFLHDFHHLPLLRGTAVVQSSFLALVLLGVPVAFGLGPVSAAAVALVAVWLYLGLAERIVATVALAALVAIPWAAGAAARATAWTGSLAEVVYELEHGAVSDEAAAAVAARFSDAPAPGPVYAALGRHHKRRGRLDEALRYYRLAAAADPRAPELQVNVGNVLFLKDDLEGAKAAYLAATDRAAGDLVVLGAANYDLSKLYLRTSDMSQSAAARERAEREAGEFLRRHGSDEDFSANRYLVDVPVPDEKIRALAATDGTPDALAAWARKRLAGNLPRAAWPWAPLALLAALWLLGLAGAPAPSGARVRPLRTAPPAAAAIRRRATSAGSA